MPPKRTATCQFCGMEFFIKNRRNPNRFCSRSCSAKSRTGERNSNWRGGIPILVCKHCGKHFERKRGRGTGDYCSHSCRAKDKTGEESPVWKGGRRVQPNGYIRLQINGRKVLEHRYVMEQHLGRRLRPDEHVHHIDGDITNNHISNLQLMSRSEHLRLHAAMRKLERET